MKDCTLLDINWGQYTELRPGIYKGKEKAGKTLKEMTKEGKKSYVVIVHYRFHWSFTVIDNTVTKKKLSAFDSGIRIGGFVL